MFTFSKIIFQFIVAGDLDRYTLFGIRQQYSELFKESCRTRGDHGAFERIFGQSLSPDPAAVKRFQKPPLPFAFDIPLIPPYNGKPVEIEIGLSLAGTALNDLPCFIAALQKYFSKHCEIGCLSGELKGIFAIAGDGGRSPLSADGSKGIVLLTPDDRLLAENSLTIGFLTPLSLVRDGTSVKHISFGDLIKPLMRRISSLSYYYGGNEPDMDFRWLAAECSKVEVRYANLRWEQWRGGIAGLVGEVSFIGRLQDYLPFLLLGEQFHLGKGAAYGMGQYRIIP